LNAYRDLFSSNSLDGSVINSNIQRLVNAVGRLANFIKTKKQRVEFIKFCEDIKNNKYLLAQQKNQIVGYIKVEKGKPKKVIATKK